VVPRALLPDGGAGRGGLDPGLHLRGGDAMARILSAYLTELHRQAGRLPPGAAEPLAAHIGSLLAAAGAAGRAPDESRPALAEGRLALVRREIERRLTDPLLSPQRAARACGFSTRTLHALFEPTGETFGQYVMRRRLHAARGMLQDGEGSSGSVADIAFTLGFNSLATFYRGYRQAFGESPGDTREAALARA
jgi:AraC-like DNA-binding protein